MTELILLIGAYLIGSIPTGIIVTKLLGATDPRTTGSGNVGATNVTRAGGKRAGILTLLGDVLKGALPTFIALKVTGDINTTGLAYLLAFFGHLYPLFLGFKGGKGVATAVGGLLVISPLSLLICLASFGVQFWRSRYVSLASITAAIVLPAAIYINPPAREYLPVSLLIAILIVFKHKDNIGRLLAGTESRFKGSPS